MPALRMAFHGFLERHEVTADQADVLWSEIVAVHSTSGRHYHTMDHLEDLHTQLRELWGRLQDPDAVLIAIVYHDFVHKVWRKDNEERSAEAMRDRMSKLPGFSTALTDHAAAHIRATQRHEPSVDPDTDLFTDADLSILGSSPERYRLYAEQIRREYRRYPDLLYGPGRRKVLQHFLGMRAIFKTAHFRERFEDQARVNLSAEMGGVP